MLKSVVPIYDYELSTILIVTCTYAVFYWMLLTTIDSFTCINLPTFYVYSESRHISSFAWWFWFRRFENIFYSYSFVQSSICIRVSIIIGTQRLRRWLLNNRVYNFHSLTNISEKKYWLLMRRTHLNARVTFLLTICRLPLERSATCPIRRC